MKSFHSRNILREFSQYFILAVIISILSLNVQAQNDTLFFWHHDTHEKMSSNNVRGIIQDSIGYMWYATQEGLNKYDGYGFIPYMHDPRNNNSLVSDDITCITTANDGIIWIGTSGKGLNEYNTYSNKWTLFQHNDDDVTSLIQDSITSIFADGRGLIWIGTASRGLDAFDPRTKKFTHFIHDSHNAYSISSNRVTCIASNRKNILWVGTRYGGINKFDVSQKTFTRFIHEKENSNSISNNDVRDIYADTTLKMIWIATAYGLNRFDEATNLFTVFLHDNINPYSISSNDVTCVFKDKYNKIWEGTAANGANVYYPQLQKFQRYSHDPNQKNSLSSNNINSISQGRSGMMWISTDNGLNAFNPQPLRFTLSNPFVQKYDHLHAGCIVDMVESGNRTWWLVTCDAGITEYNPVLNTTNNFIHEQNNASSLASDKGTCVLVDHRGIIWVGTTDGLNTIDPATRNISRIEFETATNSVHKKTSQNVTALLESHEGKIWIGTLNGLFIFNPTPNTDLLFRHSQILEQCVVTALAEDRDGIIWIGTTTGLTSLNPKSNNRTTYLHNQNNQHSIGSDYVNSIYCDAHGKIWVGAQEGGLNLFNKKTNEFINYTTSDGLPGNSVTNILEDDQSQLWIGTNAGICKLKFKGSAIEVRLYDELDGLPTPQFEKSACMKTKDGRMLFSCVNGIITMNPDSVTSNTKKPPVIVTDFFLFNKEVLPGDADSILHTSISKTDHIQLSHNQNSFSFQFTAVSFINPEKNSYAYRLDNFDKDSTWNFTDSRHRIATYTNLDPGEYTFHVKASNNDGVWNDKGRIIHITIASPYWKTWWFYVLCVLVLTATLYAIYRYRLNEILRMQNVRNKIASDLHDDVGSTLSSIAIYSELANKEMNEQSAKATSLLISINENARTTIDSMSDIVWAINPKNDRFENILQRMRTFASCILEAKNIDFKFEAAPSLSGLKLSMDRRKNLYLIFKEAVNNAAKYSSGKNCTIKLWLEGKILNMEIADDGIGFDMNDHPAGNGLLNMKKRIDEMNGDLSIHSIKENGTTIHLTFQTT